MMKFDLRIWLVKCRHMQEKLMSTEEHYFWLTRQIFYHFLSGVLSYDPFDKDVRKWLKTRLSSMRSWKNKVNCWDVLHNFFSFLMKNISYASPKELDSVETLSFPTYHKLNSVSNHSSSFLITTPYISILQLLPINSPILYCHKHYALRLHLITRW